MLNKQPLATTDYLLARYSNVYEERLRPLAPSSPLEDLRPMPRATHTKSHDPRLQDTFHNALKNGDYQQLNSLLLASSERIDINQHNSEGQTPLQQACLSGQLALVQLMVRVIGSIFLKTKTKTSTGKSLIPAIRKSKLYLRTGF